MNELVPSFKKSLFEPTINISSDLIELGIDQLLDNEVIKDIPIVGVIVKLSKAVVAIRDRYLLKKLIIFIKSINDGSISQEKLDEHRRQLESEPKKLYEELEKIMIIVDRQLDIEKTMILGNFYKSYINGSIDWDDFGHFSDILERLFISDIYELKRIYDVQFFKQGDKVIDISLSRLSAIGLVKYFNGMSVVMSENGDGLTIPMLCLIHEIGKVFYKEGIEQLIVEGKISFSDGIN